MENYNNIVKSVISEDLTVEQVVSLIELLSNKIDINTISGMARSENKTPRGIRTSNKYRKLKIGEANLCIKGISETNLPF